ncbi:MAG: SH3 domain-containing protein [Chitinispirillia bacterium]|nr:SH3 domain-containing protein [Chitinispirillia bacterium]MCL2268813.1 SH3 domain-containing protein [Chitinispirillia bacterium]
MKFARLFSLTVILTLGVVSALFANPAEQGTAQKDIQYVEVKKPFVNIYVNLDPKSDIIRQTKKGEYLELIAEGMSKTWYKVKVDGKEGWLEANAGKVRDNKGSRVITLLLVLCVLAGSLCGVVFYIRKQQRMAANPSNDPDDDLDSLPDPDEDD